MSKASTAEVAGDNASAGALLASSRIAPGPTGLPLLGVLPDIIRHRGILPALLDVWRMYGDVVQSKIGLTTTLFFARPEAVQRILVDNRDNYPRAREAMRSVARFLGEGLVSSEGAHWRRQRHG